MSIATYQRPLVASEPKVPAAAPITVAYLMSRFPKITETFILYEMLAVEEHGAKIEIYPLQRERTKVVHPEAAPLVKQAHFRPFLSLGILGANARMFCRRPRAYIKAFTDLLRGTWRSRRYFFGALAFFPKVVAFAEHMEQQGVSHVHAHFASHPAAAAFVIRRLTGIPYSFTAHGSDLHRDRCMLPQKVNSAKFVVTISNYNKDVILAECGGRCRDKVHVIHCGVDPNVFQPAGRSIEAMNKARPFTILCIGTLHEVKGQTHLIEACRLLCERDIEFVCRLVGDGPDQRALQRQAREAGISFRIEFLGRLKRDDVARHLNQADLIVAPSVPTACGRREGIPVVLIEAMASGVPVVASRLSGIPELVGEECGLLVEPGDAAGLAAAIERLAAEPALRGRFAKAGRDKVAREFNLHRNAAALIERFRRL